jgi:hypothetical protein
MKFSQERCEMGGCGSVLTLHPRDRFGRWNC